MGRVVGRVTYGGKQALSEEHTCYFSFVDFVNIKREKAQQVQSPLVLCHGIRWSVSVYPSGDTDSKEGFIAIYLNADLRNDVTDEVKAKFELGIKNSINPVSESETVTFTYKNRSIGYENYIKRTDLLEQTNNNGNCENNNSTSNNNSYLDADGALTIRADIQIYTDCRTPWTPKKNLGNELSNLLKSAKFSDVTFEVQDNQKFPAHRNILLCRAPVLATMAEDLSGNDDDEPIQLPDVDPHIFKQFLHFVYADELPAGVNFRKDAKKLLDMADKYGCTSLKLLAESEIIKLGIPMEESADLLLYAHAKNCALLQEAAMEVISDNVSGVMGTKGWANLKESPHFLSEILEITAGRKRRKVSHNRKNTLCMDDIQNMSVWVLRQELTRLGLDVDGSREVLVNRLTTALFPGVMRATAAATCNDED